MIYILTMEIPIWLCSSLFIWQWQYHIIIIFVPYLYKPSSHNTLNHSSRVFLRWFSTPISLHKANEMMNMIHSSSRCFSTPILEHIQLFITHQIETECAVDTACLDHCYCGGYSMFGPLLHSSDNTNSALPINCIMNHLMMGKWMTFGYAIYIVCVFVFRSDGSLLVPGSPAYRLNGILTTPNRINITVAIPHLYHLSSHKAYEMMNMTTTVYQSKRIAAQQCITAHHITYPLILIPTNINCIMNHLMMGKWMTFGYAIYIVCVFVFRSDGSLLVPGSPVYRLNGILMTPNRINITVAIPHLYHLSSHKAYNHTAVHHIIHPILSILLTWSCTLILPIPFTNITRSNPDVSPTDWAIRAHSRGINRPEIALLDGVKYAMRPPPAMYAFYQPNHTAAHHIIHSISHLFYAIYQPEHTTAHRIIHLSLSILSISLTWTCILRSLIPITNITQSIPGAPPTDWAIRAYCHGNNRPEIALLDGVKYAMRPPPAMYAFYQPNHTAAHHIIHSILSILLTWSCTLILLIPITNITRSNPDVSPTVWAIRAHS
eukprot:1160735_1